MRNPGFVERFLACGAISELGVERLGSSLCVTPAALEPVVGCYRVQESHDRGADARSSVGSEHGNSADFAVLLNVDTSGTDW